MEKKNTTWKPGMSDADYRVMLEAQWEELNHKRPRGEKASKEQIRKAVEMAVSGREETSRLCAPVEREIRLAVYDSETTTRIADRYGIIVAAMDRAEVLGIPEAGETADGRTPNALFCR